MALQPLHEIRVADQAVLRDFQKLLRILGLLSKRLQRDLRHLSAGRIGAEGAKINEAVFLNDIAISNSGVLYVSDTLVSRIYSMPITGPEAKQYQIGLRASGF